LLKIGLRAIYGQGKTFKFNVKSTDRNQFTAFNLAKLSTRLMLKSGFQVKGVRSGAACCIGEESPDTTGQDSPRKRRRRFREGMPTDQCNRKRNARKFREKFSGKGEKVV